MLLLFLALVGNLLLDLFLCNCGRALFKNLHLFRRGRSYKAFTFSSEDQPLQLFKSMTQASILLSEFFIFRNENVRAHRAKNTAIEAFVKPPAGIFFAFLPI